ncbi:TetR/AcrR family transcriptional regulator [Dactylosporangium sp. AC04546]|uniref:TetR/AcrR family transcriptional regulator n=1 Tax=Dactylosporangium sp. AC04546 TaxID=2862460 RepID=UPI001EDD578A|nr:TetR/AcrR family transcriptional regulator [Dactylosporangium sp. AC04546]WVK81532.1 TetR/AcrR family transcriptional regulator [Dactylosporangium sp. AC04546]
MGPRERYREQVRDEIKAHAWEQVATAGATALSLNAIAKQMGISGPALYRYFASRDDLITDLVLDAYRDLAETCEAAYAAGDPAAGRLTATAAAIRGWALAAPHRYLLIYGTPVPGYAAPPESTALASRIMRLLLDGFTAAGVAAADVDGHALRFWTRVHGVLSLEVAGHFTGMAFDPAELFAAEVSSVVPRVSPPAR